MAGLLIVTIFPNVAELEDEDNRHAATARRLARRGALELRMPAKPSRHHQDFYAWSLEQAALLRERKLAEADLDLIAEEIESMGKTEKRELTSRLTVLLLHLLKWRTQPQGRVKSWRLSIANARDEITDLLADNPSLKSTLDDVMASAYRYARRKAAIETDLGEEHFPGQCPWTFAEAIREDFWPE
jgi:hypothetical protein